MKYKLVIFDWDGTLMDSTAHIVQAVQNVAIEQKLPIPDKQQIKGGIGLSSDTQIDRLFPDLKTQEERLCLMDKVRQQFSKEVNESTQLFPYVLETLTKLYDEGLWLAVATSAPRRSLEQMLNAVPNLKDLFLITRCGDEALGKPNPQMLEMILNEVGLNTSEALMVGDTTYDMQMAMALAMDRIAVTYGAHEKAALKQFANQGCIDCISELPSVVFNS